MFLGSFAGGELAVNINEDLLTNLYTCILLYIALNYFDFFSIFRKKKKNLLTEKPVNTPKPIWIYIVVGIGAGVFAGLFGKGGGIVIVPLVISLFHYDPKAAAATSLTALQLPVGLPSVIIYAKDGHMHILFACLIAIGILAGAFIGSKIAVRLPSAIFKKVFAVFLLHVVS